MQRLQEYQREFKAFRELKDSEVAKEREEMSSYRRDLDSQLRYFVFFRRASMTKET